MKLPRKYGGEYQCFRENLLEAKELERKNQLLRAKYDNDENMPAYTSV
ncbi:MAG: hypothetical protein IPO23_14010 [Flavobacterium sp.]|nr:hypothetical protein [Flavobacterium sp.]